MGDGRGDAVVVLGVSGWALAIGYALVRDPRTAIGAAVIAAVITIAAIYWIGD